MGSALPRAFINHICQGPVSWSRAVASRQQLASLCWVAGRQPALQPCGLAVLQGAWPSHFSVPSYCPLETDEGVLCAGSQAHYRVQLGVYGVSPLDLSFLVHSGHIKSPEE